MESYFFAKKDIDFDYRDIRPKGAQLLTAGGKAPGPQPLKDCVHNIRKILDGALAERGKNCKLTSLEVHDIMCYIADAVLSGGIRRSAMIAFFSYEDDAMLNCKNGTYWETNAQRGRANNSVVLLRHKLTKQDFDAIWDRIKSNKTGEPGIFLTNDKNMLGNPCLEASLHENTFCNLVTMNVSDVSDQAEFEDRCRVASFISTLQAGYTDFHYLRDIWRKNTEKDALLGISMTGIATKGFLDNIDMTKGAEVVLKENERVAKAIGINKAARTTLTKPDGTSSLLLGSSSGIHAWFDKHYIRRVRVGKNEAIYTYLRINNPDLLEDDLLDKNTAIISLPIKAPDNCITREESALDTLERVKRVYHEWIVPGHRKGSNTHNSSVTISIDTDEWDAVAEWMWEHRSSYNGISVLPHDGGVYQQAPFESITEEQYNELIQKVHGIDLAGVFETEDHTNLSGELACAGGACEIK
jgi:ribonucleoside-diphosphate reductase alpha chain